MSEQVQVRGWMVLMTLLPLFLMSRCSKVESGFEATRPLLICFRFLARLNLIDEIG